MTIVNTKNNVSGKKPDKGLRIASRTRLGMTKTKQYLTKQKIKHGASFAKYGGPTVGLFKKTGAAALGVGKFALKKGALGIPGLVATGAYLGGKKLAKTIVNRDRGLQWAPYRQYNKKGRKIV